MLLLLIQLIDLYTIVILAAVIMSWIRLSPENPVQRLVQMLTEPVLGTGPPHHSAHGRTGLFAHAGSDRIASDSVHACPELLNQLDR